MASQVKGNHISTSIMTQSTYKEDTWLVYCEKQLRLRSEKGLGPARVEVPTSSDVLGTSSASQAEDGSETIHRPSV